MTLLKANAKNLRKYASELLGNNFTPEARRALVKECTQGFERTYGHPSHDRIRHLGRIGKILGTLGTEGMLLDRQGNDVSGECDESLVSLDVQYCNTGDSYAWTVLYVNGVLRIGAYDDLMES